MDIVTPPLVSIGIPTFNRAPLLRRSIESALQQDHPRIEIIVSDNASSDETEELCRAYAASHAEIVYIRQPANFGPTRNFEHVLQRASGEFFMWLGDDDWIDPDYVSSMLRTLQQDPSVALVAGRARYYRQGRFDHADKLVSLTQEGWVVRVLSYYARVSDNGTFYGLMRRAHVAGQPLLNGMGNDWLIVANLAARGKVLTLPRPCVHRELGGATTSYRNIARVMGLSEFTARFPLTAIAGNVLRDMIAGPTLRTQRPLAARAPTAVLAAAVILLKRALILGCVRPWRAMRSAIAGSDAR